MKIIFFILSLLFITSFGFSQEERSPKTDFAKMYLPVWLEAKEHCLEVAKAMPEDKYSYKPTDESMSFAEQMVHIAYTIPLLTKRYVQGMEVVPVRPDASKMSKLEIIELLEEGFDYTIEVIYNIDQPLLDETTKMYHSGNTVSREMAFFYVQDHMTNHRAKSNLYIRMNGIKPPAYTW